ncbi:MAG: hypothetical protein WDZ90_02530, partial [Candidatus Paceibacterota bacterium]
MKESKTHNTEWLKVVDAADGTPYSSEYLSLLARKKKLPAKKIDGVWFTTREAIDDYLNRQHLRARALSSVNGGSGSDEGTRSLGTPPASSNLEVGSVDAEHFVNRFDQLMDAKIIRERTFFQRVSHFFGNIFGTVFSSKMLTGLFLFGLALFLILPLRVFSGPIDDAFRGVVNTLKDAQTVMGFRPGTHANEILLLNKEGSIAIFGDIETEGQFKSFAAEGIAPIVVNSTTKVENLDADFVDGVSSEEFTLAFVTENGNITYEDVFLEGNVEVGKTLLVRGATKLLSTLEVGGKLHVFDDSILEGNLDVGGRLNVSGTATFKEHVHAASVFAKERLFAGESISTDGNLTVLGQSVFNGFVLVNNGISAHTGSFRDGLGTGGTFVAGGDVELGSDGSTVEITSSSWSIGTGGGADLNSVTTETLTATGTSTTNILTSTDLRATKFQVTGSATSTFAGPLAPTSGNNFVIDTGTSTQDILLNPYTGGNVGIGTSSPWRTLSVQGDAVITGDLDIDDLNLDSLVASSTITGARFVATDASATSTFAGGFAVDTNGLVYDWNTNRVGIGTSSPANLLSVAGNANITGTFDVTGAVTLSDTLSVTNLATFGSGFISQASSTIFGLTVNGNATTTGNQL